MRFLIVLVLSLFATCFNLPAQAQECAGVAEFGDVPAVPVYSAACLIGAADEGFASYTLPTGPMAGRELSEGEQLEGLLQRRLYTAPEASSTRDVYLNYLNALEAAGYQTIYTCSGAECGSKISLLGKLVIYPPDRRLHNIKDVSDRAFGSFQDEHYLAARSADGAVTVAVYVAFGGASPFAAVANRTIIHLDVLTAAALEDKMIDAAAMAEGIVADGHVAVDNIYFEFGTAKLTLEADPALNEMTKLMGDNPELKVFIVGHTDSVGDYGLNLSLSQERARAVVGALIDRGVSASRIEAAGVGSLSPVASNASDAGRQANRRVELVER